MYNSSKSSLVIESYLEYCKIMILQGEVFFFCDVVKEFY